MKPSATGASVAAIAESRARSRPCGRNRKGFAGAFTGSAEIYADGDVIRGLLPGPHVPVDRGVSQPVRRLR